MTLSVSPSAILSFEGSYDVVTTTVLTIKNTSAERCVFKVKTTAPNLYCVKPNVAYIEPKTTMNVRVMRQTMNDETEQNASQTHKFKVEWMPVPENYSEDATTFWREAGTKSDNIKGIKLECVHRDATVSSSTANLGQDGLMLLIESKARTNDDLIRKIDEMTEDIDCVTYKIKMEDQRYRIANEQTETLAVQKAISRWQNTITLTEIEGVFNEKLNFECKNYEDLKRLNRDMLTLANKHKRFGGGSDGLQCMRQLEENFHRIHSSLEKLYDWLQTAGRCSREDIQEQLNSINNQLQQLCVQHSNLDFS